MNTPDSIHVEIYYSARVQQSQPATLDTAEVLEWANLDDISELTSDILTSFVEEHDPESIIGWGHQEDLEINEVHHDL